MQRARNDPHADHPNTAFSAAFLRALARLAARRPELSTKIVLPTGVSNLDEIELVLRALGLIGRPAP